MRGKSYNGVTIPFGERAQFKVLTDDKYEDRWVPGVYVGKLVETDEFIFLTDLGVGKSRTVKQYANDADKYNLSFLSTAKGLPWATSASEVDGLVQKGGKDFLVGGASIRRMYITEQMLKQFGRTDGCPRCENFGATHSEECRRRLEEKTKASGQAFDTSLQQNGETRIIVETSTPNLSSSLGSNGLGK